LKWCAGLFLDLLGSRRFMSGSPESCFSVIPPALAPVGDPVRSPASLFFLSSRPKRPAFSSARERAVLAPRTLCRGERWPRSGGIVATLTHSSIDGTTTRLLSQRQRRVTFDKRQLPQGKSSGNTFGYRGLALPPLAVHSSGTSPRPTIR
jgi:hypothetical protein